MTLPRYLDRRLDRKAYGRRASRSWVSLLAAALGGKAKRKEHSAKSKTVIFFFMFFSLFSFNSLLAPRTHLITLSARNSTDCGIVRLSAFAVLRLITNSNFIGCSTGKSAGLAPLRILSTYTAARRD